MYITNYVSFTRSIAEDNLRQLLGSNHYHSYDRPETHSYGSLIHLRLTFI